MSTPDAPRTEVKARVVMPEGVEYFSCEVAASKVLRSSGEITFEHSNTHSTFSEVNYTSGGLRK